MVPSCHDSSMSIRLLYWVAISQMGMGLTAVKVTQIPRYLVIRKGQNVTLKCDPIPSHTALFWYRQTQSQELEFLFFFQNNAEMLKSELLFAKRYSTKWPKQSFSSLKIHSLESEDSALLFCASSL
uniref:Ig-like domain-containing protein n=1 Tax=Sarcophilus harrisii TaxID=9305 RepID=A0A7N4PZM6_SARHA